MTDILLSLGPVTFQAFEVPEKVTFGGTQRLVTHALINGGRVIEALGTDDSDISFSGILSGSQAMSRARVLDGLRRSGAQATLTWSSLNYSAIVREFAAEYRRESWVPYRIVCTVLPSLTAIRAQPGQSVLEANLTDLQSIDTLGSIPGFDPVDLVQSLGATNEPGQAVSGMNIILSSIATAQGSAGHTSLTQESLLSTELRSTLAPRTVVETVRELNSISQKTLHLWQYNSLQMYLNRIKNRIAGGNCDKISAGISVQSV